MLFCVVAAILFALPAFAQKPTIDFGIRAGRPESPILKVTHNQYFGISGVTEYFHDPAYTVGPTFALNLTDRFAIQVDAMYKPFRFETTRVVPSFSYGSSSTRGKWWEFPVMGKVRFGQETVRPFASGGFSFNTLKAKTDTYDSVFNPSTGTTTTNHYSSSFGISNSLGLVAAGGVELKAWHFRITPELRYTHWLASTSQAGAYAWPNQFDVLVGFTFRR